MFDLSRFDVSQFEISAARAAKLLRALANERRLMILCQLADGERSVGQIQPLVGGCGFRFVVVHRRTVVVRLINK